jgi:hypothetical protein
VDVTSSMPIIGTAISFSACISQQAGNRGHVLANSRSSTSDSRCFNVFAADSTIQLFYSNFQGDTLKQIASDTVVLDNSYYHHIGVVIDGTVTLFFVNGTLIWERVMPSNFTGLCTGASAVTFIGKRAPSAVFFRGEIDKVELHGHALTQSEMAAIAICGAAATPQPTPGLGLDYYDCYFFFFFLLLLLLLFSFLFLSLENQTKAKPKPNQSQ